MAEPSASTFGRGVRALVAAAALGLQGWLAYEYVRHAILDTRAFFHAVNLRRIGDQTSQLRPTWLKHPTLGVLAAAAVTLAVGICLHELVRGLRAAVRDDGSDDRADA